MIEFKDVTKKYDNGTVALRDVSITIEKGEFVFVVGSSGAGKSTFLKLMMREEVPSHGTITVDGIVLNNIKKRKIPYFRRKLGVVFQDFRLIPTMTVYDNVAFAMRVIGAKEKVIRKRVPHVLALMGLPNMAKNFPTELSGGEQQRVALARALANKAEIIIADEPTGNVDPQMSREIVQLLLKLNEQQGTTVIMVTHEHDLVREFDRRVIILDKGTVVSDGGPLVSEIATAHINAVAELGEELTPVESDVDIAAEQPATSQSEEPAEPNAEEQTPPADDYFGEEADEEPSLNDLFFTPAANEDTAASETTEEDMEEPAVESLPADEEETAADETDGAPSAEAEPVTEIDEAQPDTAEAPVSIDEDDDDEEDGVDDYLSSFFSAQDAAPGDDENGDGGEEE